MSLEKWIGISSAEQEEFSARCRSHGLRITPQRSEIFRQLQSSDEHPCADSLFRRVRRVFPRISFDTVHRTLQTFAAVGLARVVEGTGIPRRFDSDTTPHHHFWCTRCSRLIDVPLEGLPMKPLPTFLSGKHRVMNARLVLEGICADCAEKKADSPPLRMDGGSEIC